MRKTLTLTGLATLAGHALAHSGHGLEGPHWHATDTAGFLFVVVLATLAIWFARDE